MKSERYRMCRQSGNFIVWGSMVEPIGYIDPAKRSLKRIEISYSACSVLWNMHRELKRTKESIYVVDDENDVIVLEARNLTERFLGDQLKNEQKSRKKERINIHIF